MKEFKEITITEFKLIPYWGKEWKHKAYMVKEIHVDDLDNNRKYNVLLVPDDTKQGIRIVMLEKEHFEYNNI